MLRLLSKQRNKAKSCRRKNRELCYHPKMRVFWTWFLCLIVAFQSSAGAHAFPTPCPMEQDGRPSVSVQMATQAVGDCCNDAETALKTGKVCKTDTQCGSSSAFVHAIQAYRAVAQASDSWSALTALIATLDPSSVWRPPTLS